MILLSLFVIYFFLFLSFGKFFYCVSKIKKTTAEISLIVTNHSYTISGNIFIDMYVIYNF